MWYFLFSLTRSSPDDVGRPTAHLSLVLLQGFLQPTLVDSTRTCQHSCLGLFPSHSAVFTECIDDVVVCSHKTFIYWLPSLLNDNYSPIPQSSSFIHIKHIRYHRKAQGMAKGRSMTLTPKIGAGWSGYYGAGTASSSDAPPPWRPHHPPRYVHTHDRSQRASENCQRELAARESVGPSTDHAQQYTARHTRSSPETPGSVVSTTYPTRRETVCPMNHGTDCLEDQAIRLRNQTITFDPTRRKRRKTIESCGHFVASRNLLQRPVSMEHIGTHMNHDHDTCCERNDEEKTHT